MARWNSHYLVLTGQLLQQEEDKGNRWTFRTQESQDTLWDLRTVVTDACVASISLIMRKSHINNTLALFVSEICAVLRLGGKNPSYGGKFSKEKNMSTSYRKETVNNTEIHMYLQCGACAHSM